MEDYENEYEESTEERSSLLNRLADEMTEATEFNAWEYANSGNFLYN